MPEEPLKNRLTAPFNFSQSSLQDYQDCNRRFQLRYIEQLRWPAVETAPVLENERRQLEGQQFHRMIQQYLVGLPVEKITQIAESTASPELARWWGNFTAALSTNLAELTQGANYPEQSLSAPTAAHRLLAKYDLIHVQDGRATIYDWKTYHQRPKDEWMAARLQTRVYLSLLAEAGAHLNAGQPFQPENVEMMYWYAEYPSEPARFKYDTLRRQHEWQELAGLINEIAARQSFPLTPDEKKCGFCPYRSYCERGVNAMEGEESELDADDQLEINLEQIQEIEL